MQLVSKSHPVVPRDRLIDLHAVCTTCGLGKSTVYALSIDPNSDFPRKVRLNSRTVRWSETAILQWVQNRINQSAEVQQ